MNSKPSERLRLAVPNKGRIAQPILELIEKSGLHIKNGGDRKLIAPTGDPEIEVLFARPIDIPEYVANGAADIGITGRDMVRERESDVAELLDLELGTATLVLAVPDDAGIADAADLDGARIATEFPNLTRSFFKTKGIRVTIVPVGGACEATPYLGIADAIVDLASSGNTLRTNRLRVIEEILESSTILIANRGRMAMRGAKIEELRLALESVIRARGQVYVMMNVQKNALEDVKRVLPGLSGPTVMEVASADNLVAVHAVVAEDHIYQLISQLKNAGARDILVMPIERIIR
ncbi:MAG: ATP phosphoribosyltransferase [Methanomicrobiales archaeon]|nr:ATP phosphoribosyltransferase [Methanomicrobiales archaeon]